MSGTSIAGGGVSTVAAATMGAGALGFVLVLLLIVAVAGLMWAMAGSLRRLRKRVSSGEFGQDAGREGPHAPGHDAERRGRGTPGA